MTGDKIKISKVFNRTIKVLAFQIIDSQYEKGTGKCLKLQFELDDDKRILFTGSANLMDQIEQVPKDKFPFWTKIVKLDDDSYEFQ